MKKNNQQSQDAIVRHVAGATTVHSGRFSNLSVLHNTAPLTPEFIANYVAPFYRENKESDAFKEKYLPLASKVNISLVSQLMGDKNWRCRSVGAYFSALANLNALQENIGHLLLRSDVCYAGHEYCLALASFGSPNAIDYLQQYLHYYLAQSELWFDQGSAMAALSYIGSQTGDDLVAPFIGQWKTFIADKPNWHLADMTQRFYRQMHALNALKSDINR